LNPGGVFCASTPGCGVSGPSGAWARTAPAAKTGTDKAIKISANCFIFSVTVDTAAAHPVY
jgi:hypothetical protein